MLPRLKPMHGIVACGGRSRPHVSNFTPHGRGVFVCLLFYNDFEMTPYLPVEKKVLDLYAPARYIMEVIPHETDKDCENLICLNYQRNKSND